MTDMKQAWPAVAVRPLERATVLDHPADLVDRAIDTVPPSVRRALHGSWLGHPVHPLLITVPIGCWTSAGLLDIGSKNRAAAKRLVGAGLLGAVAAAATGWADWRETTGAARRVGLVHASANAVAIGLYWRSWRLRGAGRHGAGALVGLAGAGVMGLGGFLGGHMSYALGANVGSADPARAAGPAPVVPCPSVLALTSSTLPSPTLPWLPRRMGGPVSRSDRRTPPR